MLIDIGSYIIASNGEVFSKKRNRPLSTWLTTDGYLRTKINNKSVTIHRLLAKYFIPNPNNYSEVNHIDGNKLNNSIENLEWCSKSYNLHHALDNGLHANPKKAVIGYNSDIGYWYPSQASASSDGFIQELISKCVHGERASHRGMKWELCGVTSI